jgi:hypothetical protein
MVVFAIYVAPDLKYHGAEAPTAPTYGTPAYGTKLLRIVVLLVDDICLIEDFLGFFEANATFPFNITAFRSVEFKTYRYITVIPSEASNTRGVDSQAKGIRYACYTPIKCDFIV